MLKFQIVTKEDLREVASIERRRRYEDERKSRIFNARQRILGVDNECLENQIREKKQLKQERDEKERKFNEEDKRRNEMIREKERQIEEEHRQKLAEIEFYRNKFQRKEDRKEFDLYDPEYKKKSRPARLSDDDPSLGISSAQVFFGEDLSNQERIKAQRNQQRAWLEQQIKERKKAEEERADAERILQEATQARDKRTMELDYAERTTRQQLKEATAKYNKSLAIEQQNKKFRAKQEEEEDNMAEIYNHLTSDMLTENPETAQSNMAPARKVTYMYRGMSPAERDEFRRGQLRQIEEKNRKKHDEALTDSQWDQLCANVTQNVLLNEMDACRKERSQYVMLKAENKQLESEQKMRQQFVDKVVYTNAPTEAYFAQFNTSTR